MATLNGQSLGIIKSEDNNKDSGTFDYPMPRSDSNLAMQMDLMGATRKISLNGIKVGTESELKAFIDMFENLLNGEQTGSTYIDDFGYSYQVLVTSFRRSKEEASPTKLNYSLELSEGTSIL